MRLKRPRDDFAFTFEWGVDGLRSLATSADVVIVVDVLSFSSIVSAAVEAGATVAPAAGADGDPWLRVTDALLLDPGARVTAPPSPGRELAVAAAIEHPTVLAGCLRNASATAALARELAGPFGTIAVVAAGDWWEGDSARPRMAVEDLLGAGAILAALDPAAAIAPPRCSPEAAAARAAFRAARPLLHDAVSGSVTGRALRAEGRDDDIAMAAAADTTALAAQLVDGAFVGRAASAGSLHQA